MCGFQQFYFIEHTLSPKNFYGIGRVTFYFFERNVGGYDFGHAMLYFIDGFGFEGVFIIEQAIVSVR